MAFQSGEAQPFTNVGTIAVAICRFPHLQFHAGLIYRVSPDSEPKLLDLPKDARLLNRDPPAHYWWDNCAIDKANALVIAIRCQKIAKNAAKGAPYGLAYESVRKYWEERGIFIGDPRKAGLTCATFVLSVFGALGFRVVDETTWEIRPEDAGTQTALVDRMEKEWNVEAKRVAAQRKLIGKVPRIRPSEAVAATAAYVASPLDYATVEPMGRTLENLLPVHTHAG